MTARELHALLSHAAGADPRPDAELVAAARDPAAFAALVRRHGPLVWTACRRMLPEADAADAFQAVFLALARSAGRIRTPAAVGGWLHAAAVRVCLKLRRDAARRRLREKRAAKPEAGVPVADAAWDAILAAVHEEIELLPAGERTVFVVCELQGVPQAEAAGRLGWKPGTLTGRLSKARARLLTNLSARGFAPGVGVVGLVAVPGEVAAMAVGCVGPAARVSPAVVALSREVTAMIGTKHLAAAVLVAGGLLAGVGLRADGEGGGGGAPQPQPQLDLRVQVPALGPLPVALDMQPPPPAQPAVTQASPAVQLDASGRPRWEHETVPRPTTWPEFDKLLSDRGGKGWEFAGAVPFGAAGTVSGEFALVFKRPATPPGARPSVRIHDLPADTVGDPVKRVQELLSSLPGPEARVEAIGERKLAVVTTAAGHALVEQWLRPRPSTLPALPPPELPPAAPAARPQPKPQPATVGGFTAIPLKHAKAADVARTVRELYPEPVAVGGGGVSFNRWPQLIVSADDGRNMVLFRLNPGQSSEPSEKSVRKLVAELDVPAK